MLKWQQQYERFKPLAGAERHVCGCSDGCLVSDSQVAFRAELDNPSTYYLVDALVPDQVIATTILVTSPRKDVHYVSSFHNSICVGTLHST